MNFIWMVFPGSKSIPSVYGGEMSRGADNWGVVLLVSSVRTIAKAFKTLDKLDSALKKANSMPKANGSNGHAKGHTNGSAKKSN